MRAMAILRTDRIFVETAWGEPKMIVKIAVRVTYVTASVRVCIRSIRVRRTFLGFPLKLYMYIIAIVSLTHYITIIHAMKYMENNLKIMFRLVIIAVYGLIRETSKWVGLQVMIILKFINKTN